MGLHPGQANHLRSPLVAVGTRLTGCVPSRRDNIAAHHEGDTLPCAKTLTLEGTLGLRLIGVATDAYHSVDWVTDDDLGITLCHDSTYPLTHPTPGLVAFAASYRGEVAYWLQIRPLVLLYAIEFRPLA